MSEETREIISRLEKSFSRLIKKYDHSDVAECSSFQVLHGMKGYEIWFNPEVTNYDDCLSKLNPDDIIFDVGAGDLRFDLIMAEKVRKVYAVEINPKILASSLRIIKYDMPENLIVICGNAFDMDLPGDVTVVTCLMIHRQHEFPDSWKKARIISYEMNI